MKLRKLTSLTAAISFLLMLVTSVVLYIVPHGRVAYWADWRLWGLTKTDWGNIHINFGLLFLLAMVFHIYLNWKPLVSYLKDRARQFKLFTMEFNLALLLALVVGAGTYLSVPPFEWVIGLSDSIKDKGTETYGEPPYGHAELSSLKTFSRKMKLDLDRSMALLEKAGYPIENEGTTLAAVGRRYGISPQQVYGVIRTAADPHGPGSAKDSLLPESPPAGTGNATLADFCLQFGLNLKQVEGELKKKGITASAEQTLKKIAAAHHTAPADLYETLRKVVRSGSPVR